MTAESINDRVWAISLSGSLDQSTSSFLENTVENELQAGHSQLVIDMRNVEYISSSGLKALIAVWKRAHDIKGNVVLAGLRPAVREMIHLIGFDLVFTIYDSLEDVP